MFLSIILFFNKKCLSNGEQINYGRPYDLLQNKKSVLYEFVHKLGNKEEERLFQIAKEHAFKNKYISLKSENNLIEF